MLAIIDEARRSLPPRRAATCETLIGLLAASALRIGEALRLDRADIYWAEGVLHVRRSKFRKSSLVPLTSQHVETLGRYVHQRDRLSPIRLARTCSV